MNTNNHKKRTKMNETGSYVLICAVSSILSNMSVYSVSYSSTRKGSYISM